MNDFNTIRSGVDYYLVNFLSRHFNFTYSIFDGNKTFGSKLANGSLNGVVGWAERGDVDFSLGGVSMTLDRNEAVQFSVPYIYDPITFIIPRVYAFESGPLFVLDTSLVIFVIAMIVCFILTIIVARVLFDSNYGWKLFCNFNLKCEFDYI